MKKKIELSVVLAVVVGVLSTQADIIIIQDDFASIGPAGTSVSNSVLEVGSGTWWGSLQSNGGNILRAPAGATGANQGISIALKSFNSGDIITIKARAARTDSTTQWFGIGFSNSENVLSSLGNNTPWATFNPITGAVTVYGGSSTANSAGTVIRASGSPGAAITEMQFIYDTGAGTVTAIYGGETTHTNVAITTTGTPTLDHAFFVMRTPTGGGAPGSYLVDYEVSVSRPAEVIVIQDDFAGMGTGESVTTSALEEGSGTWWGSLQSDGVGSMRAPANPGLMEGISIALPDFYLGDIITIKAKAARADTATQWFGIGFSNSENVLSSLGNNTPWATFDARNGSVNVMGGTSTSNSAGAVIRASGSPGTAVTEMQFIYDTGAGTVTAIYGGETTHQDVAITTTGTPTLDHAFFVMRTPTGITGSYLVDYEVSVSRPTSRMYHQNLAWKYDPDVERYKIQIAKDDLFTQIHDEDIVSVHRYVNMKRVTPLGTTPVTYWWRVAPITNGITGAYCDSGTFTIEPWTNRVDIPSNATYAAIQTLINSNVAPTKGSCLIVFAKDATYDVALSNKYLFQFADYTNILIDGNGATINLLDPNSGFASLIRCSDISIQNITINHSSNSCATTYTVGTITEVDKTLGTFNMIPLPGHLPPDDPRIKDSPNRNIGCLMDPDPECRGKLKDDVYGFFAMETNVLKLANGKYQLYPTLGTNVIDQFAVGDVFLRAANWRKGLISVSYSTNITMYGITGHATGGGFIGGLVTDGLNILRCRGIIEPGTNRWMSVAGGFKVNGSRIGMWIEECELEGLNDDSVHSSVPPLKINDVVATNKFNVYDHYVLQGIRVGDHLTIFDPQTGTRVDTVKVNAIDPVTNGLCKITVDASIATNLNLGNTPDATQLFIQEMESTATYVRNNLFYNSRRHGCLFNSRYGVIEGNIFMNLSGNAINLANVVDPAEGFECTDVSIVSNEIYRCGYDKGTMTSLPGSIRILGAGTVTMTNNTHHEMITVYGNEIYDWQRYGIFMQNSAGSMIVENTITNTESDFLRPAEDNTAIYVRYTLDTDVKYNDVSDTRTGVNDFKETSNENLVHDF